MKKQLNLSNLFSSKINLILLFIFSSFIIQSCGGGAKPEAKVFDYAKYNGTYENTVANEYSKQVIIKHLKDSTFSFEFTIGTADQCTGTQKGEATATDSVTFVHQSKFNSQDCKIEFKFADNQVNIVESGMCDHGTSCNYQGTYTKK